MRPESGARFELRLSQVSPTCIRYDVEVASSAREWRGTVDVTSGDGLVEFAWGTGEPPAWCVEFTRATLRSAWRARRNAPVAWPRRITRWRGGPDEPREKES